MSLLFKILAIGDVVGRPGRSIVCRKLPLLVEEVEGLRAADVGEVQRLAAGYDNEAVLAAAVAAIRGGGASP